MNVDAIDEQESLENRHNFLSEQVQDLNSSRAQLQQLINRLNKKSRERFQETFEEIRRHFQETNFWQGNSIIRSMEQYYCRWQERSRRLYRLAAEVARHVRTARK